MKAFLMFRDHNLELQEPPPNERELIQDLELDALFDAMANGDKFVRDVARGAVLSSLTDADAILYRQGVLKDCLENPQVVRDIYNNAVEALGRQGEVLAWVDISSPIVILNRSVDVLLVLLRKLKELRDLSDAHGKDFESEGFRAFFAVIERELPYEYLHIIQDHVRELKFDRGALTGAELGQGNKGSNYSLRRQRDEKGQKRGLVGRVLSRSPPDRFTRTIDVRDEEELKMLSDLRERGVNTVANALAQSADHVLGFFGALRTELAFYLGCMNLRELLGQEGEPTCFPVPAGPGGRALAATGLYDACLAIKSKQKVVANDIDGQGKDLVVVTGANRGGKSTFLRSVGLAQLMMQCGAFVPAESFSADIRDGLFSHFKREEDPTMKKGKLEEELSRMSDIVDRMTRNSMVLLNESFASTNQREGSEIAGQIVSALLERGVKVFFITHQYDFARTFYEKKMANALFLRAERKADGERTFKVVSGEPLETSYGEDLYDHIFLGAAPSPSPATRVTSPRKA